MRDLKRRVSDIDGTFANTARHISAVHNDLLAFRAKMDQRLDQMLGRRGRFDKIDGKFDRIERELRGLRADIPKIVRDAVRDALRRGRGTSR